MAISYNFNEQLIMSNGHSNTANVQDILLKNIPGALSAYSAHKENDLNGTDYWIEHSSGKWISVDCKIRETDFAKRGYDDLALETWSVVERGKVGWTRDAKKRTDYVLWLWVDTGRWCLVPFSMLCHVFQENWRDWHTKYKVARQRTPQRNGGYYHSECVFVPRREVWARIYCTFSGSIT